MIDKIGTGRFSSDIATGNTDPVKKYDIIKLINAQINNSLTGYDTVIYRNF